MLARARCFTAIRRRTRCGVRWGCAWHRISPSSCPICAANGDSSKPPAGDNFINYSKRALALDQVEVMAASLRE
jgi:hypothetical protein